MGFDVLRQTVRVDKDHRIVLRVPDLAEGTELEVTVSRMVSATQRTPGSARGAFKIEEGFDDPLPDLKDYR